MPASRRRYKRCQEFPAGALLLDAESFLKIADGHYF